MKNRLLVLLVLSLFITSCASVFSRSEDTVTIKTAPEGASVYLDGDEIGQTPLTKPIKRRMAAHKVTIKKEGYKTQTFTLKKSVTTAAFFNCTFILSWGTDALTGKMFEYSPNSYFIDMESTKTGSTTPESLKYLLVNHKDLVKDFSKRGGEYSKNLSMMLGKDHQKMIEWANDNMELVSFMDSVDLHEELTEL